MKKAFWVLLIIPVLISCNGKKVKNLEQKKSGRKVGKPDFGRGPIQRH